MADFYPYLIASLPMLHFGMEPPFSWEKFLLKCADFIPAGDFQLLSFLPLTEEAVWGDIRNPLLKKWIVFDTSLRNELVKIRSSRQHLEPTKYLRPDADAGFIISHIALAASRNPAILEAEKYLDQERWKALEELSFGHYFDLEHLIVYAYKLRILERWDKIRQVDKKELLERVIS